MQLFVIAGHFWLDDSKFTSLLQDIYKKLKDLIKDNRIPYK